MNQKRVLVVEPAGELWGSERVLIDFLRCLEGLDWNIMLSCPYQSKLLKHLKNFSIRILPILIPNTHQRGILARLCNGLGLMIATFLFRPHLIYLNQAGIAKIMLFILRFFPIPLYVHVRIIEEISLLSQLNLTGSRLVRLVCSSHYMREITLEKCNVPKEKVNTLYDPYESSSAPHSPVLPTDTTKHIRIVCMGRLAPIKGQIVLLETLRILKKGGELGRATFLGEPAPGFEDYEVKLKETAFKYDLTDQVQWCGFQENVFQYLASHDVLVCPSFKEPLGRVIFEAWDAGILPVAWKESGGCAEVIHHSGGGLLYEEQSGDDLAKVLRRIMHMSHEEKKDLIARGRQWTQRNCNPRFFTQQMLRSWKAILDLR